MTQLKKKKHYTLFCFSFESIETRREIDEGNLIGKANYLKMEADIIDKLRKGSNLQLTLCLFLNM